MRKKPEKAVVVREPRRPRVRRRGVHRGNRCRRRARKPWRLLGRRAQRPAEGPQALPRSAASCSPCRDRSLPRVDPTRAPSRKPTSTAGRLPDHPAEHAVSPARFDPVTRSMPGPPSAPCCKAASSPAPCHRRRLRRSRRRSDLRFRQRRPGLGLPALPAGTSGSTAAWDNTLAGVYELALRNDQARRSGSHLPRGQRGASHRPRRLAAAGERRIHHRRRRPGPDGAFGSRCAGVPNQTESEVDQTDWAPPAAAPVRRFGLVQLPPRCRAHRAGDGHLRAGPAGPDRPRGERLLQRAPRRREPVRLAGAGRSTRGTARPGLRASRSVSSPDRRVRRPGRLRHGSGRSRGRCRRPRRRPGTAVGDHGPGARRALGPGRRLRHRSDARHGRRLARVRAS